LYVAIAVVIIVAILAGSHFIIDLFQLSLANKASFREILIIFFIGMGVVFPAGIFPEILIGQQKILLTNVIFSISIVLNFFLLLIAAHFHLGIKTYLIIGL